MSCVSLFFCSGCSLRLFLFFLLSSGNEVLGRTLRFWRRPRSPGVTFLVMCFYTSLNRHTDAGGRPPLLSSDAQEFRFSTKEFFVFVFVELSAAKGWGAWFFHENNFLKNEIISLVSPSPPGGTCCWNTLKCSKIVSRMNVLRLQLEMEDENIGTLEIAFFLGAERRKNLRSAFCCCPGVTLSVALF